MGKVIALLFLVVGAFLTAGCQRATSEDNKATLRLALPAAFDVAQKNWGISDPSGFEGYNCYLVFVEAPDQAINTCKSAAGNVVSSPLEVLGGYWAGAQSSIEADVSAGPSRKISIVGTRTTDAATCANVRYVSESNMSPPAILGSTVVDLPANNTKPVDVSIQVNYSSRVLIDECAGPDFNPGQTSTTTSTTTTTTLAPTNALVSLNNPSLTVLSNVLPTDGTPKDVVYTLTNSGTEAATSLSVSVSGAGFSVINSCGSTLAIGANCNFTLRYIAQPPASYPYTLTVNFSDSLGAHTVGTAGSANTLMIVESFYDGRDLWNDAIEYDGPDIFSASNATCDYADPRCIQVGRMRKVTTGYLACSTLTMTDSLNAFRWECHMMNGYATFVSTELMPEKGLRNLLDAGGNLIPMSVQLFLNASPNMASTAANWWPNQSVLPLSSSTGSTVTLSNPDTIYVATSTMTNQKGWYIAADGISIVTLPLAVLGWPTSGVTNNCNTSNGSASSPTGMCMIFGGLEAGTNRNRLWIETNLNIPVSTPPGSVIFLAGGKHSAIHNTDITSANTVISGVGLALMNSSYNEISSVRVSGLGYGMKLTGTTFILSRESTFANNATNGIYVGGAQSNTFYNTMVNNAGGIGIQLVSGDYNSFINTFVFSNAIEGIKFLSHKNTTVNTTAINNGSSGLTISTSATYNSVANLLSLNNTEGITISGTSSAYVADVYAAYNSVSGITHTSSSATFSNQSRVWLGLNGTPCSFSPDPTNLALANCSTPGGIVATTSANVPTFLGAPYTGNDPINTSDTGAAVSVTGLIQWFQFATPTRSWAKAGTAWTSGVRGNCYSGSCQVYDLQLSALDTAVRNINGTFVPGSACPASVNGSLKVQETFITGSQTYYLLNAVELLDRPMGNNNGLCEANETCVFSPNIGAYQGRGDLTESCIYTGSAISNVKMLSHILN